MSEAVDHPAHYGSADNPYEAIKVIEAWQLGFCDGNVVKYLSRWRDKGGVQDLHKALWYLQRFIAQEEGIEMRKEYDITIRNTWLRLHLTISVDAVSIRPDAPPREPTREEWLAIAHILAPGPHTQIDICGPTRPDPALSNEAERLREALADLSDAVRNSIEAGPYPSITEALSQADAARALRAAEKQP